MQWSLKEHQHCTDYISLVRGKSNIVQVYDTQTENVFAQKRYESLAPIKGLGTLGKDVFDLRHVLIDEKGKMLIDKSQESKKK